MKSKKLLLLGCLAMGIGFGANAQVPASQPDTYYIGGSISVQNTGLAIAPNIDVHAAAFDYGAGYKVYWIDGPTGIVLGGGGTSGGNDPDVAFFADESAFAVVYENSTDIYVDEYIYTGGSPLYIQNPPVGISGGYYPNIDMNSAGRGIISWENGGDIWLCSYTINPFVAGPPVQVNAGTQADVVLMDDGITVGLTYIDPVGNLMIETSDYNAIQSGGYAPWNQWQYPPMTQYEKPRIASQRNQCCGPADDFSVVVQDHNGFTAEVHGFFGNGGSITNGPVQINDDFLGCSTVNPLPAIVYDRDRIQIVWSQNYMGGCSPLTTGMDNDVLLRTYDLNGNPNWPGIEEVNMSTSFFDADSKNSIATEYDGFGYIIDATFKLGLLYNDQGGNCMWKTRNSTYAPNLFNEHGILSEQNRTFSLIESPVDQTIEVLSEADDFASFQLLDNAGRIVELNTISSNDNVYSIDISHLSGGMYFLNCSSAAGNEVLRILQVTK